MIAAGAYMATRCQAMAPPTAADAAPHPTNVGAAAAMTAVIANQASAPAAVATANPEFARGGG